MCSRPCLSSCAQRVGPGQRLERARASPARRSPRGQAPGRAARRRCAATAGPAAASGRPAARRSARTGRGRSAARKRRACSRTWSARLAMRRRGRRRATPTASQRTEQLERAVLGALGRRDARHGAKAEQHRLGQAAALEHVEPVGQQGRGLVGLVALPHRGGQQRRQHAGERAAPAEVALGARQRRAQQVLGQQHLAFPQVGQADDEVAPAVEVAERRARARRAAPAAGAGAPAPARPRAACGRPSGWRAPAAAADRAAAASCAQGSCSSAKRSGSSAKTAAPLRISAHSQRSASSTPGCARMRSTRRLGLLVPLAQRQRPGRGQQQARPAVELVGRQPRQPVEHRALAAARHQRFVQAALGQVVGRLALAGGQRVPRRRFEQAVLGQPRRRRARAAPPARRPAAAAKRCRSSSRASACMRSHSPASPATKTGVSRASRASRSRGVGAPASAAAQVGMQRGRGSRCGSGRRRRPGRGWPAAASTKWSRSAPPRAAIADTSARGSLPAAIADSASCRPSGQPSVSSCRRAAASRSTRLPRRARTSSIVSSSWKRSCAGPTTMQLAVGDQVVDARDRQSARAATTTRRLDGALRSR